MSRQIKIIPSATKLVAAVLLVFSIVYVAQDAHSIQIPQSLHEGDLVFRNGRGLGAMEVSAVDPMAQYTHVGIVSRSGHQWTVIHASPQEGNRPGVAEEPLVVFASNDNAQTIGFFRVAQADRGLAVRNARSLIGLPFDEDLNLRDHTKIYCTELVRLAFFPLKLGIPKKIGFPGMHAEEYLTISSLLEDSKVWKLK